MSFPAGVYPKKSVTTMIFFPINNLCLPAPKICMILDLICTIYNYSLYRLQCNLNDLTIFLKMMNKTFGSEFNDLQHGK